MRIEDREEYIDLVAQTVIDKIEERDRMNGLVSLVTQRVLDLQREQVQAEQDRAAQEQAAKEQDPDQQDPNPEKENTNAGE